LALSFSPSLAAYIRSVESDLIMPAVSDVEEGVAERRASG
jgi:hypothetical protein